VGIGGRSACFDENDNRVRYTGKERDGETGLDYFLARYYSGAHGRFTSPDPLMASARISDPQTWNRYAYVRNNPINMIDPDGMDPITLNPSVFQYYQSMGWDTHEILNFFDSLPGANWSNSFYTYFDANLTAFYNHQYVDYWGQRNDQILYPTSGEAYVTDAPERMMDHLGLWSLVDRRKPGQDDQGKFTMVGFFSDVSAALKVLNGSDFRRGCISLTHSEVGGRFADFGQNRIDYRQKDLYGVGSLQVVVNPETGYFYADMDKFDAYNIPVGFFSHITVEVLAPRVENLFLSIFR